MMSRLLIFDEEPRALGTTHVITITVVRPGYDGLCSS